MVATLSSPPLDPYSKKVVYQCCEKSGHTIKFCCKLNGSLPTCQRRPTLHHAKTVPQHGSSDWIMDLGVTHHITDDLQQLHLSYIRINVSCERHVTYVGTKNK